MRGVTAHRSIATRVSTATAFDDPDDAPDDAPLEGGGAPSTNTTTSGMPQVVVGVTCAVSGVPQADAPGDTRAESGIVGHSTRIWTSPVVAGFGVSTIAASGFVGVAEPAFDPSLAVRRASSTCFGLPLEHATRAIKSDERTSNDERTNRDRMNRATRERDAFIPTSEPLRRSRPHRRIDR
jgi:hypothetical protein